VSYAIDQTGVEMIASFEGYVDGVYNDSRGFATCGVGHLLHRSPATQQDHRTYDGKGRAFFLGLLHDDIERVSMGPMRQFIHVPLNQNRVNALASLAFNCGGGCLAGTVGRKVNARDWAGAQAAFMLWSNPPVLRARREQEAHLFERAAKTKTPLPWLEPDERRWCLEYDRLLHAHKDEDRRRVLRRYMHARALEIRSAAHHEGGWERAHRRQRYHSLNARSS
jgi:GH24 family phage-related lysozyme (muramidase)